MLSLLVSLLGFSPFYKGPILGDGIVIVDGEFGFRKIEMSILFFVLRTFPNKTIGGE